VGRGGPCLRDMESGVSAFGDFIRRLANGGSGKGDSRATSLAEEPEPAAGKNGGLELRSIGSVIYGYPFCRTHRSRFKKVAIASAKMLTSNVECPTDRCLRGSLSSSYDLLYNSFDPLRCGRHPLTVSVVSTFTHSVECC
jgi:hypothetical protein